MDGVLITQVPLSAELFREVFERLSLAVVLVDGAGVVVGRNAAAGDLLGPAADVPATRCCDLVACGRATHGDSRARGCVTDEALERGGPLSRVVALGHGQHVTLMASPVVGGVMLQLRPVVADAGHRQAAMPPLHITTLGHLELTWCSAPLGGTWVHQRPGQVLRYLLTARGRRVPVEELVDAIWPGPFRPGIISLRKSVHTLRERIEPDRPSQAPSRFIVATPGAYALDMEHVRVDADEFESLARAALLAADHDSDGTAEEQLERAIACYGGDFLADDHYGEWVLAERDRLRSLALRVLRRLAELHLAAGRLPCAVGALERVVDLEPLDPAGQRELMALLLRTGGHATAARRYETFRRGFGRAFGTAPDFVLSELMPAGCSAPRVR